MKKDDILHISGLFKLFSDPTRLRILTALMSKKEMCVNDIADCIQMSHSATSHQLAKLEVRGLVHCERKGKTMCYKIQENSKTKIFRKLISLF